jgi:polyferredoxin
MRLRAFLLFAAFAIGLGVSAPAVAQDSQPPVGEAAPPIEEASPADDPDAALADDPWGFGDEEEAEPTLAELARNQAWDIGLFAGFAVLAMVSFFRKSDALKVVTLVAAVGYLGLYKSQLLSIVNVFGLTDLNFPPFRYSLGWYAFAIFSVATTVLWGRLYCGRVCAFGAVTQLLDRIVPKRIQYEVPRKLEDRASYIKYGILVFVVGYYVVTSDHLIFRYVEPFWMFSWQGNAVMWTMLGVLLTASLFVCPLGAFLGVMSQVTTVFRIKRWSECSTCRICEKTCEWGAIRGPKIIKSECVRCDDCERLYADEQKCPHWIIFYRKDEIAARKAARAAAAAAAQFTPSTPSQGAVP